MPEERKSLNFVFSVKDGGSVIFIPVDRGTNIGYGGEAGRKMYPGLVLKVDTSGSKPKFIVEPSVMFASRTLDALFQYSISLFGSVANFFDFLREKKLALEINRYGMVYRVNAISVASWIARYVNSDAIPEEKLDRIYTSKLGELDDFDGKRIAAWYDEYAEKKGWLKRSKPSKEEAQQAADDLFAEDAEPVTEDNTDDDLSFL